jgi:hypothetical protein
MYILSKARSCLPCLYIVAAVVLILSQASVTATQGWGTDSQHATTITWDRFKPVEENSGYIASHDSGGYVYSENASDSYLYAPVGLGDLPNGVELKKVSMFYSDTTTANEANMQVEFCRSFVDTDDGGDPDYDCFVTVSHTVDATIGDLVLSSSNLSEDILYQFDVDSDTDMETVSYYLRVHFGATNGSNKLRQIRFLWQRQISPPPDTPTFSDVPESHYAYEWIEALVDAGITHGCGGGKFCPNNTVNGAQMAVFISEALGLHFPAEN